MRPAHSRARVGISGCSLSGDFRMGIDDHSGRNGEAPSYASAVKAFRIDATPVTNAQWKYVLHYCESQTLNLQRIHRSTRRFSNRCRNAQLELCVQRYVYTSIKVHPGSLSSRSSERRHCGKVHASHRAAGGVDGGNKWRKLVACTFPSFAHTPIICMNDFSHLGLMATRPTTVHRILSATSEAIV